MAGGGTINYYKNDGSSVYVSYSIYDNGPTPKTISEIGWSRSGYEFVNWNTSSDGTGTIYGIDTPAPSSGTTNLYAIWEALPDIDITYKGSSITTMSASGTEVLETEGKYCEDDITVTYTKTAGSASTPATTITANPTISISSGGLITASVSGSQSVTPTVLAGYVSTGTAGTITVSGNNTQQLATQAAQTITPTTSNQTISSGTFLTGDQTILGDTNLVASNIASGISIFGVTGTFAGGGDDLKNFIEQHDTMTSFTDSTVTIIGRGAFAFCSSLTTVNFPSCSSIGYSAFTSCERLTTLSFPVCKRIDGNAFADCSRLTSISFPLCSQIGTSAFCYCYSLTTISFPSCSYVYDSAFRFCSALTSVSFSLCSRIGASAFANCIKLTTVSFNVCSYIESNAFFSCSSLTTAYFPSCSIIASNAFTNCSRLTTISFPVCAKIYSAAFSSCFGLTTVSFPSCISIMASAFLKCYNLVSLYLMGSKVIVLQNSNAFTSTPIAGYTTSTGGVYGSIFVPSSLYSTYIASTNWVYFSSRFVSV